MTIGNKLTGDARRLRPPLAVTGIVRALTDGEHAISAPTCTGPRAFIAPAERYATPAP
ncbi:MULTISPECIES: hypothetical protein [Burkholderiaceae]|uniref:hypothetical protein n=1 Tax=Burkholderiaceae TaxID=119060 RepID=UPI001421D4AC|nr:MULTISPECIES: hypothetical protein [Burkholderiaceae]MBN3851238.1 hypothetical protein [Paraburkholderia sp. Ac-20342]